MTTPSQLRELLAKATSLPWNVGNATDVFSALGADSGDGMPADSNDGWHIADCGVGAAFCGGELTELGYAVKKANAALIVAAVNALPALLAAAEERDALRARLDAAPVVTVREVGGSLIASSLPEPITFKAGDRLLLLPAPPVAGGGEQSAEAIIGKARDEWT